MRHPLAVNNTMLEEYTSKRAVRFATLSKRHKVLPTQWRVFVLHTIYVHPFRTLLYTRKSLIMSQPVVFSCNIHVPLKRKSNRKSNAPENRSWLSQWCIIISCHNWQVKNKYLKMKIIYLSFCICFVLQRFYVHLLKCIKCCALLSCAIWSRVTCFVFNFPKARKSLYDVN